MSYRVAKRVFDVVSSLVGLIATAPLWIIAVIGIEISDPGPVFYIASRIGKDNKEFGMYKFRSMRQGKANEAVFRGDEDRIFLFGKFIRKTKIDELPQLLNVLFGTMSIVGPRPAAVAQASIVRAGKYNITSKVAAGLTGPSALYDYIYGDSIEEAEEYEKKVLFTRLELDVYYVNKMSMKYDMKMIWYTVICIIATVLHIKPQKILKELTACVSSETEGMQ